MQLQKNAIMNILTDYSWLGVLACAVLGMLYAIILYISDKKSQLSPKARWIFSVLRCLSVFMIGFLLLSPLVKISSVETEKPVVVILQDNSQSIVMTKDSTFYSNGYLQKFNDLKKSLSEKYDVEVFSFGGSLQNGFDGSFDRQSSDISLALSEIHDIYKGRNVGAIVLASDGIFNAGTQPTNLTDCTFPIYTIALGDTSVRKDAAISNLKYNSITYLNSRFPVEISIKANKLSGKTRRMTVESGGKTLFQKNLSYSSDDFFTTENVMLDADKPGVRQYTVKIEACEGEVSTANNVRTFTVEVIDSRRKIAVIAQSPHPDVGAIKRCFESVETYEVETFSADDFDKQPSLYNLIILHQLPSDKMTHNSLVEKVMKSQTPVLFVLGQQTAFDRFDRLQTGLAVNLRSNRCDEATAAFNSAFPHFAMDENTVRKIEAFPPLSVPFGKYRKSENVQTLIFAKTGNVVSEMPMVAFSQKNGTRYGFVVGDGLWKWFMDDFRQNSTHENIGTLMEKTAAYLSLRLDKEKFRVNAKVAFAENEAVTFESELYNDNFEPVTDGNVIISVNMPDGKTSTFASEPRGNHYYTSAGTLPQGSYTYTASAKAGGKKHTKNGSFVVEKLCLEQISLTADHSLLNTIAGKTGGYMLPPQDMDSLPQLLDQHSDIRNIMFSRYKNMELINWPWFFVIIVVLLGTEWIARRYKNEI